MDRELSAADVDRILRESGRRWWARAEAEMQPVSPEHAAELLARLLGEAARSALPQDGSADDCEA